jgi:flagellar basal body-associated protein FliL
MNYVVAVIVAVFGGLAWFFKSKSDQKSVDATLAETKGKDAQLQAEQLTLQDAVKEIDTNLAKAKAERDAQNEANKNLSLKERRLRQGLK